MSELSKCVRCGSCKTYCPTYLTTHNESMGARGRVAMLGELGMKRLDPSTVLADRIFSCMLCGACKGLCPAGINIPEVIYRGRAELKKHYHKSRLLRKGMKYAVPRMDTVFSMLRAMQKMGRPGMLRNMPDITPKPFKKSIQIYKNTKKKGRIAIFAGCSVNYFYPDLGNTLTGLLLSSGYEVVVFKGEVCCGAPLRSMGLEKETSSLARRNIAHFNKVRAEAIVSMCPTCTMVIREQYPLLVDDTITNIMDISEFIVKYEIAAHSELKPSLVTYHDPCHLSYGLGIRDKPRDIIKNLKGIDYVEMKHADECCGFAGLFSLQYRKVSDSIGKKKIENIINTSADTVITSCPGCIMQLEILKREAGANFKVKHIVELLYESMHE